MWRRFCHPENALAAALLVGAPAIVAVYSYAAERDVTKAFVLSGLMAAGAFILSTKLVRFRAGQECTI